MFYSTYFPAPDVKARLVSGYEVNPNSGLAKLFGKDTRSFSLGYAQGSGGMISTPEDMALWTRALFEGDVLPAKQVGELKNLVAITDGQPVAQTSAAQPQAFGLGVFAVTDPALGTFWGTRVRRSAIAPRTPTFRRTG